MPYLVVVADDLTGAMDTAHGFAERGCETRVGVAPSDVPSADVIAVNSDSRYVDARTAASAVRRCVSGLDATIYKKVDSTLRGNVVAEVDAAIEESGAELAIVAPAFPATGRTTRDGIHRVDGVPLDETEYAADENGPSTADLPRLLGASRYPVVHVGLDVVDRGPDAIAAAIDTDGPVLAACDATEDDHLAAVARSVAVVDGPVVFVGSGGLARHVDVEECDRRTISIPESHGNAPLGIVGSVNEHTIAALDAVPDDVVVAIDPGEAVRNPVAAGRDAGTAAADRLTLGDPAVVTAARRRSAVDRAIAAGEACGLGRADVGERVRESLSNAARTAVGGDSPSGLLVTGGDVAVGVFDALDATSVSLTGEDVEAGIPIGVVDDGLASGLPVVTKAGGFGGEATIVNCLRALGD